MDNQRKEIYLNNLDKLIKFSKESAFFISGSFRHYYENKESFLKDGNLLNEHYDVFDIKNRIDSFILDLVAYLDECSLEEASSALKELDNVKFRIIDEQKYTNSPNKEEHDIDFDDVSFFDLLTMGSSEDNEEFENAPKLVTAIYLLACKNNNPQFANEFTKFTSNREIALNNIQEICKNNEELKKKFNDFIYNFLTLYNNYECDKIEALFRLDDDSPFTYVDYIDVSDEEKFKDFISAKDHLDYSVISYALNSKFNQMSDRLINDVIDILVKKFNDPNDEINSEDYKIEFRSILIDLAEKVDNRKYEEEISKAFTYIIPTFPSPHALFGLCKHFIDSDKLDEVLKNVKNSLVVNDELDALLKNIIDYLTSNGSNLSLLFDSYITYLVGGMRYPRFKPVKQDYLFTVFALTFRPFLEGKTKEIFDKEFMESFKDIYVDSENILTVLEKHVHYEIEEDYKVDMFKACLKFFTRILCYLFEKQQTDFYSEGYNLIKILNDVTNSMLDNIKKDQLLGEFYEVFKHTSFGQLLEQYKDLRYKEKDKLIERYKNA